MPHQWLEGNLPVNARCCRCDKTCGSIRRLQDYWCLWCHSMVRQGLTSVNRFDLVFRRSVEPRTPLSVCLSVCLCLSLSLSLSLSTPIFQMVPECHNSVSYWSERWRSWRVVTTGAIRRAKLQSNRHHQQANTEFFLQAGCLSCYPTNSVKALKGKTFTEDQ